MRDERSRLALMAGVMAAALLAAPPSARTQTATDSSASTEVAAAEEAAAEDVVAEEPAYSEEDLDELVAPVALYPDPLLAQVLVAATFPIEIVKAARWVDANKDMAQDARADAAMAEGWDPSVSVLAAGFPTVISKMSTEIEWTEDLGDAVLVQSDDVMDAVQRQRARAAAVGNLETNAAQEVTVENDNISIAPAQPEVVYVPTYDSQAVYTTAPTAAPVVVNSTEPGFSTGTLVTTGLLAFGAGLLVAEIFDDDDDHWHGYWGPRYYGPGRWMDWDDHYFYPRPGYRGGHNKINIETGDITINRNDIDRDGRWKPDNKRRDEAREKIGDRKRDRDREGIRDRNQDRTRDRSRDEVRNKMAARSEGGGAKLDRKGGAGSGKIAAKPSDGKATAFSGGDRGSNRGNLTDAKQAKNRGQASKERAGISQRDRSGQAKAAAQRPAQQQRPAVGKPSREAKPQRKATSNGTAFQQRSGGGKQANRAASRGKASLGNRR